MLLLSPFFASPSSFSSSMITLLCNVDASFRFVLKSLSLSADSFSSLSLNNKFLSLWSVRDERARQGKEESNLFLWSSVWFAAPEDDDVAALLWSWCFSCLECCKEGACKEELFGSDNKSILVSSSFLVMKEWRIEIPCLITREGDAEQQPDFLFFFMVDAVHDDDTLFLLESRQPSLDAARHDTDAVVVVKTTWWSTWEVVSFIASSSSSAVTSPSSSSSSSCSCSDEESWSLFFRSSLALSWSFFRDEQLSFVASGQQREEDEGGASLALTTAKSTSWLAASAWFTALWSTWQSWSVLSPSWSSLLSWWGRRELGMHFKVSSLVITVVKGDASPILLAWLPWSVSSMGSSSRVVLSRPFRASLGLSCPAWLTPSSLHNKDDDPPSLSSFPWWSTSLLLPWFTTLCCRCEVNPPQQLINFLDKESPAK